jgi:predicted  nucleic acid-binding Zn-ribbon protein
MKNIWKHKWVVMPIAVAIILAAGAVAAVALADPGNAASTATAAQLVTATTAQSTGATTQAVSALAQRRAKLQQRLEQLRQRLAQIRAKMTPQDQAALDQLLGTVKDQRQALQQARQDLAGTLKQMRTLVQKYRPTITTVAPAN